MFIVSIRFVAPIKEQCGWGYCIWKKDYCWLQVYTWHGKQGKNKFWLLFLVCYQLNYTFLNWQKSNYTSIEWLSLHRYECIQCSINELHCSFLWIITLWKDHIKLYWYKIKFNKSCIKNKILNITFPIFVVVATLILTSTTTALCLLFLPKVGSRYSKILITFFVANYKWAYIF
jgi:hypothetical protein